MFAIDPEASAWAAEIRSNVLRAAEEDPYSAAETGLRIALGGPGLGFAAPGTQANVRQRQPRSARRDQGHRSGP